MRKGRLIGLLLSLIALSAAAISTWRSDPVLDTISGVDRLERPMEQPTLLLSGQAGSGDDVRNGWIEIDLASGVTVASHWLPSGPPDDTWRVRTVGGSSVLYQDRRGEHIFELISGMEIFGDQIAARWPLLAPWRHSAVISPGRLAIEAMDGRLWALDLGTGAAAPLTLPLPPSDLDHCTSRDWPVEEGRVLTFSRRASDGQSELVRAKAMDGGQYSELEPMGAIYPIASFLCDEATGRTAVFHDGSALVLLATGTPPVFTLTKLRPDGRLSWGHDTGVPSSLDVGTEVLGMGHSMVVRIDDIVLRIRADGGIDWQRSL